MVLLSAICRICSMTLAKGSTPRLGDDAMSCPPSLMTLDNSVTLLMGTTLAPTPPQNSDALPVAHRFRCP
jgi:hypothetical protein